MNIDKRFRAVVSIFIEGVIVYLIMVYLVIGPIFRSFYVGEPAVGELPFAISYISVGIAVGFTTIALMIYPVLKYKEVGEPVEE
ncbi:MAG: hypothetical protein AMDU3_IPLC00001G0427 [Thermoplasmatales archaeon I-plasma]|nr:MAG: hypothetical protein AMDU3_IPLC00001G0427 [Thermoplasmatales archaeon I-plasma]MCL4449954.1 hypothetical protein [Candidatus Thermoplasmatota archaeon]